MTPDSNGADRHAGLRSMVQMMDRFSAIANASNCFGGPVRVDDKTIIPAAEVVSGMGFGMGSGEGSQNAPEPGESDDKPQGSGEGGGGGGFVRTRPVAVVVVAPDGISVEPIVDATQIAMAGLAAGVFLGFWIVRMFGATEGAARKGKAPSMRSIVGALRRA